MPCVLCQNRKCRLRSVSPRPPDEHKPIQKRIRGNELDYFERCDAGAPLKIGGKAEVKGPISRVDCEKWGTRRRCACYLIVKVRVFDVPPPGVGFLTTMLAVPADVIEAAVT